MTFEVSTNLIPVLHVGHYWNGWAEDYVCDSDDIKGAILNAAPDIVEEAIREVCPSASVSNCEVYMPRQYNYGDDEMSFDLTISDEDYNNMYDACINNPEFASFLQKNYHSYDGFISFMADNIEDFETQEDYKKVSQMIMFLLVNDGFNLDNYAYDFYENVDEYMINNCPRYSEYLGGNEQYRDVTISFDYEDGKDCFIVYNGDEKLAVFPVETDTKDGIWDAYNQAYDYCNNELQVG